MPRIKLGLAWTAVTALVLWAAPLYLLRAEVRSLPEILPLLGSYALIGAGLGLVAGMLQTIVLYLGGYALKSWWLATLAGFGLAFPAGLLIGALIPWAAWGLHGQVFLAPGSGEVFYPSTLAGVLGGFVVGIVQWRALRVLFPGASGKEAALWALGAWLSLGLGAFPRLGQANLPVSLGAALLAGLVSAAALILLLGQKNALPALKE